MCAAVLGHLAEHAPLVMVVSSGNKSLHGWFYCEGHEAQKVRCLFDYALTLGADKATWTKNQLVRMPDGLRDKRVRQKVCYFAPHLISK
jgi:hypothetical protein